MQLFSNNGKATLAQALLASDPDNYGNPQTAVVVEGDGGADTFAMASDPAYVPDGAYQFATLTHSGMPGIYEVVIITARPATNEFVVERAKDGTIAQDWPVGAVIEARVTAGMLKVFAQEFGSPGSYSSLVVRRNASGTIVTGDGSFRANCRSENQGSNRVQISGWPVLGKLRRGGSEWGYQDAEQITPEVMGRTLPVSLGQVSDWAAGYFADGDIVRPTVANGYQYVFEYWEGQYPNQMFSEEPDFAGAGGYPLNIAGGDGYPEGVVRGSWIPSPDPLDMAFKVTSSDYGIYFMPTEVGFVCTKFEGATPPSVSIGTPTDPTGFVNDQAMAQIAGARQCQRWPVAAGGALVESLQFKLETAATGVFEGFFFWRGVFMDLAG